MTCPTAVEGVVQPMVLIILTGRFFTYTVPLTLGYCATSQFLSYTMTKTSLDI